MRMYVCRGVRDWIIDTAARARRQRASAARVDARNAQRTTQGTYLIKSRPAMPLSRSPSSLGSGARGASAPLSIGMFSKLAMMLRGVSFLAKTNLGHARGTGRAPNTPDRGFAGGESVCGRNAGLFKWRVHLRLYITR